MTRGRASGLEQAIDGFAATAFALCVAASLVLFGVTPMGAVGGAAVGGTLALVALGRVGPRRDTHGFRPIDAEFEEPAVDELLLEDRLVEPEADSAVVRLFAVGGGGTAFAQSHAPGELKAQIDRFLDGGRSPLRAVPAMPDATQELYEALADIRRTLR